MPGQEGPLLSLGVESGHPALPTTWWDLLQVLPLRTLPTSLSECQHCAGGELDIWDSFFSGTRPRGQTDREVSPLPYSALDLKGQLAGGGGC